MNTVNSISDGRNLTLLTDLYELTMMQGYFKRKEKNVNVIFDAFYRKNPDGNGYAISCGLEQLIELIEQNAVVPLDGYIERGVIDPGDRDLGNVTFDEYDDDEQTTGERHVYALQASSLTGMNDALSFNPEGKYMAIVRFSQNPDTAAAVMQEMIELF